MKKIFLTLIILFYVSSSFCFEMDVRLSRKTINPEEDVSVTVILESLEVENLTIYYSIDQDDETLFVTSEEKINVQEEISIKKTIGTLFDPGFYYVNVLGVSNDDEKNFTSELRVVVDCITFSGITNSYTLPNQSQEYEFTLRNTCEIDLHNITIFFQEKNYSVNTLVNNKTIRIENITSPKEEKNMKLIAEYYEGRSEKIIEFRVRTQQEIDKLFGELMNNTSLLINKTSSNQKLIFVGDKTGIETRLDEGLLLINLAIEEYELQNYALSIRYLLESIPFLREASNQSNEIVSQQITVILILAAPLLGIILLVIYNKYKQAVKTKQSDELGKS